MQTFQDTFETRKRPFLSAFSVCMTVPLNYKEKYYVYDRFIYDWQNRNLINN